MENNARIDGLVVGEPFYVIQLFDREGFHSTCVGQTLEILHEKVRRRDIKGLIAITVPFVSTTWHGEIPDVSMPDDFKEALAVIDRPGEDET